jgi:hypothetical protein
MWLPCEPISSAIGAKYAQNVGQRIALSLRVRPSISDRLTINAAMSLAEWPLSSGCSVQRLWLPCAGAIREERFFCLGGPKRYMATVGSS